MIKVPAISGRYLALGYQGENRARCVVFNLSRFRGLYGDGNAQILVCRPNENKPYPAVLTVNGEEAIWELTNVDTAVSGNDGKAELRWYVGETLAKSEAWRTVVIPAIGEPADTPPDPYENWMEEMLLVGAVADTAKNESQEAARESESARDAAELERKSAELAAGESRRAQISAELAQGGAETARRDAEKEKEAAGSYAEAAIASARNAAAYEAAAKTQADAATLAKTNAESAYSNAKTSAESAATSAKEAKDAAARIDNIRVDEESETLYL